MKLCIDCEFARKIEEDKQKKLMCINKESWYYRKTFGLNAHACK